MDKYLLQTVLFNIVTIGLMLYYSVGEWEIYLVENSSFIFYGMERLLSYIPPPKLSALNIPGTVTVFFKPKTVFTESVFSVYLNKTCP